MNNTNNCLLNFLFFVWIRLAEVGSSKQKLTRQLRDRDEELDDQRQKTEALKLEVKKLEKAKRDVRTLYKFN